MPHELELDKIYEIVISSPLSGLIRYKIGDLAKMRGWFKNMPVISICGRRELILKSNIYQITEQECIDCFKFLNFYYQFTFFIEKIENSPKLGCFIEINVPSEKQKKNMSQKIHEYFIKKQI
jgi:hypothetical protein